MAGVPATGERGDGEERSLWAEFDRDRTVGSRERLFFHYRSFAKDIARRRFLDRGRDIEFADLCQLAYVGLLEAIDAFKPALPGPFKTFAVKRISGSIVDGLNKLNEFREQLALRRRLIRDRMGSLRGDASDKPAERDDLKTLADVAIALAIGFILEDKSLQGADTGGPATLDPYESLEWKLLTRDMKIALEDLSERERQVVQLHYFDGLKFSQITELLQVTPGRVSQIHNSALNRLKAKMISTRPPPKRE